MPSIGHKGVFSTMIVKRGIIIYIILLIFEGALRKWILPGLASPLLIIRDPLAAGLLFYAARHGIFILNRYVLYVWLLVAMSFIFTLIFGHGNLSVALYGVRVYIIHFPFIFLMGKVLNEDDIFNIGKLFLIISIPMTLLMAAQFYSPQSAFVNRGIGGDISGGGFSGAMGYLRPPGTFSFIGGLVSFYAIVSVFLFNFLVSKRSPSKILLAAVTFCILAAIPLSISRSLFVQVGITVLFTLLSIGSNPKYFAKILLSGIALVVIFSILTNLSFFQTSVDVFSTRVESASRTEGSASDIFVDRFLGGMISAITNTDGLPFWGYGIGMGTNVGAVLLTGKSGFLVAEGEWGRLVGEMGILLGFSMILLRVIFVLKLSSAAFSLIKKANFLPWIMLSFSIISVTQGQWAQPTALGFATISAGILVAALRNDNRIRV